MLSVPSEVSPALGFEAATSLSAELRHVGRLNKFPKPCEIEGRQEENSLKQPEGEELENWVLTAPKYTPIYMV